MSDIGIASAIIKAGGLVAFPTETVYGLGANALDAKAVAKIFSVKKRPQFDPLIVHIASLDQLQLVTNTLPAIAEKLIEAFWPGPLTLILEKTEMIPDLVTSGLRGVGVRMPANTIAQNLIIAAQTPIAAPSANTFGSISPTCAEHVKADLGNSINLILDGGQCEIGIESTIIFCMGDKPILLRPGGIALEEIESIIGKVIIPDRNDLQHASPGRFSRHYAPATPMILADTVVSLPQCNRMGLLSFSQPYELHSFTAIEVLSKTGDLAEAACNLFSAMKKLDSAELDLIVATPVPNIGLGKAINDRLIRAAQKRTTENLNNSSVKESS